MKETGHPQHFFTGGSEDYGRGAEVIGRGLVLKLCGHSDLY